MMEFNKLPIMSCAAAKSWERHFFNPLRNITAGTMPEESDFMERAGCGIADKILSEYERIHKNMPPTSILVLVGKGHNGGDALIAAREIVTNMPEAPKLSLAVFADKWDELSPLTMDAYESLLRVAQKPPTFFVTQESVAGFKDFLQPEYSITIDGIYGYGFHPPMPEHVFKALIAINESCKKSLRAAIDLPSGVCDSEYTRYAFAADFTFAAGIVKTPALAPANAAYTGRVIPQTLGFPIVTNQIADEHLCYALDTESVLASIPMSRPTFCDKRDFGHVIIVGGSRDMPGALLLNTLAALRSGAGLVSVLCPENVHAAFAARAPGAMWVPCKLNRSGGLDFADTCAKLKKLMPKANTILCGSGMGTSQQAQKIILEIAKNTPKKIALILDADALTESTISALRKEGDNVLLPHEGEFLRIGGDASKPHDFCSKVPAILALKGAYTRVVSKAETAICFAGTPALARGGSGDVLAGTVAGLFAARGGKFEKTAFSEDAFALLCAAVEWHGAAAKILVSYQSVRTAAVEYLPEFLGDALKED